MQEGHVLERKEGFSMCLKSMW